MRKLYFFGLLGSMFFIGCSKTNNASMDCLPANLQAGVVAFYPFSSGALNDASGNGHNLLNTTTALPDTDRNGNPSCAFRFIRSNQDFLTFSNPVFLDYFKDSAMTISIWYKAAGLDWRFEHLVERARDREHPCNDSTGQWHISLHDLRKPVAGINEHSIWYYYNNGAQTTSDLSNVWQHLIVSWDGSAVKLYLNGVSTTNSQGSGSLCYPYNTNTSGLPAGDLFIGANFEGMIDDIIIYNRVLTEAEIAELYNLPACCQ